MLYVYATCFLLAIAAQDRAVVAQRLFAYWGIILCAGYLFKLSVFAIAPTLAIFSLFLVWRDLRAEGSSHPLGLATARRLLEAGVILVVPSIIAIAIWTSAAPSGAMGSSVGEIGPSNLDLLVSAQGEAVARRMFEELATYLASYKLPVTLLAALGFVFFGWTARWRMASVGFIVFIASTGAGLYLYYLYREPFAVRGLLESFPRFINLPLRIFHMIGFLALAHAAIRIAATHPNAPSHARIVHVCLIGLVCVGLGWQVRQVARAAEDMTDRRYQTARDIQVLMGYKADLLQIRTQVEQLNLTAPKLGIVDPRGDVAMTTALYYSLRTERDATSKSYRYFTPVRAGSFEKLESFDVLWPVNLSAPEAALIAKLTDDPACASHVNDYLLVRTADHHFSCLGKNRK